MKTPKNLIEFIDLLWTEEQSIVYLEGIRWNWVCPKCSSEKYWRRKTRRVRICANCRYSFSVTAWTILNRARIPLRKILLICWLLVSSKEWVSAEELWKDLWISVETAWSWSKKFRKIMVLDNRTKLSWNVEIDEVFIWWKQEWKRWRGALWKEKIVIAVEINTHTKNKEWLFRWMWRVRIKVIPNCSEKTLSKFIIENIEEGSTIYTDWWLWYKNINNSWYEHIIEKKWMLDIQVYWINKDEVTPNVHIIASLIKRWLLGTHQWYLVKWWYLQEYLEEYTFRFNRRKAKHRGILFKIMIEQIIFHW